MEKYLTNPIVITVASALLITIITVLTKRIVNVIHTSKIVKYMDNTPRKKFRSKFFDSESISADVNLSKSEVEKLCTKSKKIKKIKGYGEHWVLRKNYNDGEEIPPQDQVL